MLWRRVSGRCGGVLVSLEIGVIDMLQTKTYMARPDEIAPKWWLVDAADKVVGRLASDLAMLLMGKNRPTYTPHVNNGDYVIVINAEKVVLTGRKWEQKQYAWYTGHPGQHTETAARRRKRRRTYPPRGRSADAAEEQAGLQDARQAEDLQRQRAPAPGPEPELTELGIKDPRRLW